MGWSRGTPVAIGIIESVKKHVKNYSKRVDIYVDVIETLEDNDWDTVSEAMGYDDAFDEAVKDLHPDWFEEEEEDEYE